MLLRNMPGDLVEDLPKEWSGAIRSAGLSVILMRSGLELDLDAFKKVGWMAVRLVVTPGCVRFGIPVYGPRYWLSSLEPCFDCTK
jgi:NhaP-type Na+/H+ or K+/H+ antiporter